MPHDDPPPDLSPRLIWAEDGSPRSGRFDDVYYSRQDGLAESRAVFLAGCGLPEVWVGRSRFTVGELGFGTGLNIAALLDLWQRTASPGAHLHIFSVEGFPLRAEDARRALAAWPTLAGVTTPLLDAWPDPTPGFHRIDLPACHATLDLAVGEVGWALEAWQGRADAWFLDGFAPATNPDMWSPRVLDAITARSAPGARLATFTVAGAVRRGLTDRGFAVAKCPGHGRKRERLEAILPTRSHPDPALPSVAVIGAGIAGAALVRALAALGVTATVIETVAPGAGGSGFPAALVTPRLDAGDAVIAALGAQALDRATTLYAAVPGAVLARGVLQLEQAPRDARRFARVADQALWPDGAMRVLSAGAASERLGEDVPTGGLDMTTAMAVAPSPILAAWLADTVRTGTAVHHLEPAGDGWRLIAEDGTPILTADRVIIAAGWGSAALLGSDHPVLAPVRGQAGWTDGPTTPAVAWGGYAIPTADGVLYGATHDRGDTGTDVRDADGSRNLEALRGRLPDLAARIAASGPGQARAAVRATTSDRLPLAGALPESEGVFMLTGLGSRAFSFAPLLAEHVAALVLDRPSPLPAAVARQVDPARLIRIPPLAEPRQDALV
ncbi:FAD-dependent 5-carboxymethylaminomethyl-2-thiouridine(34) oxidoreductase MnmC [uncultured Brevundimonas sp.]|uniref:FAD-dependent 5-carboxymethylaminomethyl-2-thiouridine(34) oxidoreductase MnmC n=1 Tax=uncultured Brevundimonas sp. TaxID=213418 RepID=UPI0030EF8FF9|tara:strand:+ start:1468 stop:3306 length:1839 start_codon:yes stop_codon:yes gene_type:complete